MNRPQTDPGLRVVRDVFEQLQIDDAWSVGEERGFRWWPHRRSQHVWADPPVRDGHLTVSLVHAEAEFLIGAYGADLPPRGIDAHLGVMAGSLSLHGVVRDGDRVQLHATAFVHEENQEWVSPLFQMATLIQATNAELRAPHQAELLGLVPATSEHPISGARPEPDEMLEALDSLASREVWGDAEEYAAIAQALGARGLLSTAGEDGLTVEFPVGPDGGPSITGGRSNLLTVAAEPRDMGHGIRLTLRLRDWPRENQQLFPIDLNSLERHWSREDNPQLFPPELNSLEAQGLSHAHLLGSWAIEGDGHAVPHFTSWVPNVLYRPGVLMNLVVAMGVRSRWVSTFTE